jgi:hypothetical protein
VSKNYLKKSYLDLNITVEDYFKDIDNENKLKGKLKFTDYATITNKNVLLTRSTIEEIDEKTYNKKIKKAEENKENNTVTFSNIKFKE